MHYSETFANLLSSELAEPVAVTAFKDGAPAPFNIILCDDDTVGSDNRAFAVGHSLTIERYTETSGEQEEITAFLLERNIAFEKEQTYLDDERLFMTVYSLTDVVFEKL